MHWLVCSYIWTNFCSTTLYPDRIDKQLIGDPSFYLSQTSRGVAPVTKCLIYAFDTINCNYF